MESTDNKDYELLAIKTVIRYFKEQGIRLNLSDFNLRNIIDLTRPKKWETNFFSSSNAVTVVVMTNGVLKKYVGKKADNFLNYVNARVFKDRIEFSFSFKELDIIYYSQSDAEQDVDKEKLENIKLKIQKLIALADKSQNPSENEAISASLQVQKLLAKYHLTMNEVTDGKRNMDDVEQVIADCGVGSAIHNWRFQLAICVANGYCCKQYIIGREQKDSKVVFYGYKEDVLSARRIFTYLYNVGNKLGNQYSRTHKEEFNSYKSFCYGFVEGVQSELERQCTALALIVQPEIEEQFEAFTASFGQVRKRTTKVSADGYKEGIVEGKRALNGTYLEQ